MTSKKKSRAWVFVVNNPDVGKMEQFCLDLKNSGIIDYVFQLEKGNEDKTLH